MKSTYTPEEFGVGNYYSNKDRLVRFGLEWLEKFCYDHDEKIMVMNAEGLSPKQKMTKDHRDSQ
jgi:predicted site-specific integrase-resolvase